MYHHPFRRLIHVEHDSETHADSQQEMLNGTKFRTKKLEFGV
jgi:hypothetical protein